MFKNPFSSPTPFVSTLRDTNPLEQLTVKLPTCNIQTPQEAFEIEYRLLKAAHDREKPYLSPSEAYWTRPEKHHLHCNGHGEFVNTTRAAHILGVHVGHQFIVDMAKEADPDWNRPQGGNSGDVLTNRKVNSKNNSVVDFNTLFSDDNFLKNLLVQIKNDD
jgi:hypothetical protein